MLIIKWTCKNKPNLELLNGLTNEVSGNQAYNYILPEEGRAYRNNGENAEKTATT